MTELVWNGKYDEKGELKPVDRTILPFQVVETVNESKPDRDTWGRGLGRRLDKHPYHDVDIRTSLPDN